MYPIEWLSYLVGGGLAGFLAGLFGVGGGLLLVPVLLTLFASEQFPNSVIMPMAVGTSLATIVPTGVVSALAHHRRGGVNWSAWQGLTPGLLIGALGGALFAKMLGGDVMRLLYGLFVIAIAVRMARASRLVAGPLQLVRVELTVVGGMIGGFSALVGIGGGTLTVPYLAWRGLPVVQAVGTSAAAGVPIALAGAIGYIITGQGNAMLPLDATGYVVWTAVAGLSIMSMLTAPLGAMLAHRLAGPRLRQLFAGFLIAIGVYVLIPLLK